MTICRTEVFLHPIPSITELRAPPSNSHQTRPVICRQTYPNENHPRNFARVEPHSIKTRPKLEPYSIETRPTLLQPVDLYQTQMLELVKMPYETGKLCKAMYLVQCMVSRGYRPDLYVCTQLIQRFFDVKDAEKAIEVMNILESRGEPNLFVYNVMIDGFSKLNRIDDADEWLHRLRARGCAPNIVTYNILIGSLCRRGKLNLAFKLLDKLLATNCRPTIHTYTILLKATIAERGVIEAMKLLNEMSEAGVEPDIICYNMVLKASLEQGKWLLADKLRQQMLSRGCEANRFTKSLLALASSGMQKPITKGGQNPNPYGGIANSDSVVDSLCKSGDVGRALETFYELDVAGRCPNLRSFNCLMIAMWKVNRSRAIKMVEEMLAKGYEPDVITYNSILSCICRDRMADAAMRLLKDMESCGVKPNVISYNMVLLCLCKDLRVSEAIDLLAQMIQNGCRPNETTYSLLLEGMGFAGLRSEAMGLASSLVEMGALSPDAYQQLSKIFPVSNAQRQLTGPEI